jgi:hypothetical protein
MLIRTMERVERRFSVKPELTLSLLQQRIL